ncbi:hypothetical protein JG688_00017278 [Phytophthora aleatoria]|uniref:Uncharacterized protein n=1 Tax=Phytophthora aleatoria TaxID=2496075 RepID=A0A8J5MCA3_9STRA|nr:hypothetical protein JG688_00017278 [Phytophthora aleatoria]
MVKPIRMVPRDSEVTARYLLFKSVWRELRGEGWIRKPPPRRSLDDRYKYIGPNGHPDGTVGIDFFLGKEAVLEYYANVLRSRARVSARLSSTTTSPATTPNTLGDAQLAAAQEVVRRDYLRDIEAADFRHRARIAEGKLDIMLYARLHLILHLMLHCIISFLLASRQAAVRGTENTPVRRAAYIDDVRVAAARAIARESALRAGIGNSAGSTE